MSEVINGSRENPNEFDSVPVDKPTVEQEIRTLAIQVAANRCENVDELIKFASEIEAYLLDGTVPVSD